MSNIPMYGQNKAGEMLGHLVKTLSATMKADNPDQLQFQVLVQLVKEEFII